MKKIFTGVILTCIVSILCSCNKPTLPPNNTTSYAFPTDSLGRIWVYHGINISNFSKTSGINGIADTPWVSIKDLKKIKDDGYNLVRMLWHWEALEPTEDNGFNEDYIDRQVTRIKWLYNLDIPVIVVIHQDLFCKKYGGNGFPEWTNKSRYKFQGPYKPWNKAYGDPAVIDAYTQFWDDTYLINRYRKMLEKVHSVLDTFSNVIAIDVMNEPFPGATRSFESKKLSKFYMSVLGDKSAYEPWMGTSSGAPTLLNLDARNCYYMPHYYDVFVDGGLAYGMTSKILIEPVLDMRMQEATRFNSYLIIGEFGVKNTPDGLEFLEDLVNKMEERFISWCYWSYDPYRYNDYSIVDNDLRNQPQQKILVRPYAQRIAGTNPEYYLDNGIKTLKYELNDAQGMTILYVPNSCDIMTTGVYERIGTRITYYNTSEKIQEIKFINK